MGYQLRRKVLWAAKSTGWARVVVGEIADAIQDDAPTGDAWPGISRLSRMYGVHRETIITAIKHAEEAGDIKVSRTQGRVNHYILSAKLVAFANQSEVSTSRQNRPDRSAEPTTTSRQNQPHQSVEPTLTVKEPQVEPQMNAEATDTGPIPFSDPDPFTRAARRAGIGSQPSKRVAVAKEKAAAKFDLGELENAPAIKIHREVCGYVPMTAEDAQKIVASANGSAETTWRANLNFWMAKGYRADNTTGQTERHEMEKLRVTARGNVPAVASVGQWNAGRGMYPQVADPTPAEFAAAEARAKAQREARRGR